jgi:2-oxoglutarate ferredoxin oxidoreductase subunit alpha
MVEDAKLSVRGDAQVNFYGRPPGSLCTPEEIFEVIKKYYPDERRNHENKKQ